MRIIIKSTVSKIHNIACVGLYSIGNKADAAFIQENLLYSSIIMAIYRKVHCIALKFAFDFIKP